MAQVINLDEEKKTLSNYLLKSFQSANINFLIGSGCSASSIPTLGPIENEINQLEIEGKIDDAERRVFSYLYPFLYSLSTMTLGNDKKNQKTIKQYRDFLCTIYQILELRKSNILPKRATVFSTNYDLFFEKAFEEIEGNAFLCDGFKRTPSLTNQYKFMSTEFNNSIFSTGYLYNYKIEIPVINLIKIHGSLNWKFEKNQIFHNLFDIKELLKTYKIIRKVNEIKRIGEFVNQFSIVLPRKEKFRDTLLNQTYYDLLRIYSNELEKENSVLIVIGFSFADEHIREITKRALKNPTLLVVIFCYLQGGGNKYAGAFQDYKNVKIVYSDHYNLDFNKIIQYIGQLLKPNVSEQIDAEENKGYDD